MFSVILAGLVAILNLALTYFLTVGLRDLPTQTNTATQRNTWLWFVTFKTILLFTLTGFLIVRHWVSPFLFTLSYCTILVSLALIPRIERSYHKNT
ncbi:hypothetical protein BCY86_07690 [Pajaroellobacter abortibovis]|uniref:Uncharacterized protein n=1 Tax=Pajaroellobacter abortibovis TaxID=1882918 RepID=A0A1L6MYN2_9BACT|nr:hypothetical protein BCY86_07690 [Pajaroellobacter abortibovis]